MIIDILKDFLLQLALIATLMFTFEIFFAEGSERNNHSKIILSALSGLSILLCMSFPAYVTPDFRIDIRIVPLLLGTLYGGLGTGLVLSVLIILYRLYLGGGIGVYTTILTLFFTIPVILILQKSFTKAKKKKGLKNSILSRLWPALDAVFCICGIICGPDVYCRNKIEDGCKRHPAFHHLYKL